MHNPSNDASSSFRVPWYVNRRGKLTFMIVPVPLAPTLTGQAIANPVIAATTSPIGLI